VFVRPCSFVEVTNVRAIRWDSDKGSPKEFGHNAGNGDALGGAVEYTTRIACFFDRFLVYGRRKL